LVGGCPKVVDKHKQHFEQLFYYFNFKKCLEEVFLSQITSVVVFAVDEGTAMHNLTSSVVLVHSIS